MTTFDLNSDSTRYSGRNALCMGAAANLAYAKADAIEETVAGWGFNGFRFFDQEDTQAFLAHNEDAIIVAFRGTEPSHLQDLLADAKIRFTDGPFGQVHRGFLGALEAVWPQLDAKIRRVKEEARARREADRTSVV